MIFAAIAGASPLEKYVLALIRVRVAPGGMETKVRSIVAWQEERPTANGPETPSRFVSKTRSMFPSWAM